MSDPVFIKPCVINFPSRLFTEGLSLLQSLNFCKRRVYAHYTLTRLSNI